MRHRRWPPRCPTKCLGGGRVRRLSRALTTARRDLPVTEVAADVEGDEEFRLVAIDRAGTPVPGMRRHRIRARHKRRRAGLTSERREKQPAIKANPLSDSR